MADNNCSSERASKVLSCLKLIYPDIYTKASGDGFDAYINAEGSHALCHISSNGDIVSRQCDEIKRKINSYVEALEKEITMAEHSASEASQRLIELEGLHVEANGWPIAKMLAGNCRASSNEIAKAMHMHDSNVKRQIALLEEKYGIRYTIDINLEGIGFLPVVIFGKFLGEKPGIAEMENEFLKVHDLGIQFAASLSGKYDFIVFYIAGNAYAESDYASALQNSLYALKRALFASYSIEWVCSPTFKDYELLPLRDGWFSLLEGMAWKKSKEHEHPYAGQLTYSKYQVLRELFVNARESFSDMDRKLGKKAGESYTIASELVSQKLIRTFTLQFGLHPKSIAVFLSNSNAAQLSSLRISYSYIGRIYSPAGEIAFLPIMSNADMEKALIAIKSIDLNAEAMKTEHIFIDGMRYGIQSFST